MRRHSWIISLVVLVIVIASTAMAGEPASLSAGADFVSRYVWRGFDFGNSACIQPSAALGFSGAELGMWGSYPTGNDATGAEEFDLWFAYTVAMQNGVSITGMVNDYFFPSAGYKYFNFDGDADSTMLPDSSYLYGGGHTIEVGLSITGPETFPITLSGYMNVHNEAGNNVYIQADYPAQIGGTAINLFAGVTPGSEDNLYYGTDGFALINVGFQVDREVKMTDDFSLPVFINFSLNTDTEISYIYFGFSL